MRYALYIIIFIILSFIQCNSLKLFQQKNDDIIYWSKDRPLTWDDFQAKIKDLDPKVISKLPNNVFAFSWITISFLPDINAEKENIIVTFDKSKSFVRSQKWATDEDLRHEQYHFNIAELYARKYRKISDENPNINERNLLDSIRTEHMKYQHIYDNETNYGDNEVKQQEWELKIDKELEELEKYSSDNYPHPAPKYSLPPTQIKL